MPFRPTPAPLACVLLAAATLSASPSTAQAAARATPDTARLRQALAATFGGDFRIVRHELSEGTPERGGTFWLVHAQPTRSGNFHLAYRYAYVDAVHPERPLYTHVQHESYIRVGGRGCLRRREGKDVCLGDTIILPFVLNDYGGHAFTLAFRGTDADRPLPPPQPWDSGMTPADSVPNPVGASLRLVGTSRYVMLHRVLGSTTVFAAGFEAVAPGRFNLSVGTRRSGEPPSPGLGGGSVPVIVVARGQPVTVLLQNEQVTGRDSVHNFSSHSGNQYLTTPLILQPGDRITLEYHRFTIRGRDDAGLGPHPTPSITRLPFRLDTADGFNAWIADAVREVTGDDR